MRNYVFILCALCYNGKGYGLNVKQEEMHLKDLNKMYFDMSSYSGYISPKGLHVSFILVTEVPQTSKVIIKAYKKINDNYRFGGVQIKVSLPEVFHMEAFDLQSLFIKTFQPPLKWPLRTNVRYQCNGWVPDPTKFPAALPYGHFKIEMQFRLPNDSTLINSYWFIQLMS